MGLFAYEARDEFGRLTSGVINADNLEQASATLSARNLFVTRLAANYGSSSGLKMLRFTPPVRVKRQQIAWFMAQLAVMIETGIPLSEALECLARQNSDENFRKILEKVSKLVQEGRPLSDALEQFPRIFPTSITALIRASEASGTMARVLQRVSGYLMGELQILRKIRGALMYPAFMFVLAMSVAIFLLTVILPRFAVIFAKKGAVLPAPTRILMGMSDAIMTNWALCVLGVMITLTLGYLWSRSTPGKRQIDAMKLNMPVFSRIFNNMYQARAFRTMGMMLETGVPLIEALAIIREISTNSYYRELWEAVDHKVKHGERIAGPLLESVYIPESIAQMIDSGDKSGRLPMVFDRVADFVENEFNQAITVATQFIEPVMILVLGGGIGFVAAALLLPLFQAGRVVAQ